MNELAAFLVVVCSSMFFLALGLVVGVASFGLCYWFARHQADQANKVKAALLSADAAKWRAQMANEAKRLQEQFGGVNVSPRQRQIIDEELATALGTAKNGSQEKRG